MGRVALGPMKVQCLSVGNCWDSEVGVGGWGGGHRLGGRGRGGGGKRPKQERRYHLKCKQIK